MSKASEFEALRTSGMRHRWSNRHGTVLAHLDEHSARVVAECGYSRSDVVPTEDGDAWKTDGERHAAALAFVANNFDLIARALRLMDRLQSAEMEAHILDLERLADAAARKGAAWPVSARFVLATLRDSAR